MFGLKDKQPWSPKNAAEECSVMAYGMGSDVFCTVHTDWTGWYSELSQYTQDTGTHCGLELADSMASSTAFTLSSTSLFTRTRSQKGL